MTSLAAMTSLDDVVTLSSVHMNLARELERLHRETLALQAAISPELAKLSTEGQALLSLQALDSQAQILSDLSRLAHAMSSGAATGNLDTQALFRVDILQSTSDVIFAPVGSKTQSNKPTGDVTLF